MLQTLNLLGQLFQLDLEVADLVLLLVRFGSV